MGLERMLSQVQAELLSRIFCPPGSALARTRWNYYISDLVWFRLGVKPGELSRIVENRLVFRVLLRLLLLSFPD